MHDENLHNDIVDTSLSREEALFWKEVKPPFKKSKREMWEMLDEKLDAPAPQPKQEAKVISFNWIKFAAATVALLMVGAGFFARFYTVTVDCNRGDRLAYNLPDGSTVHLNSASSVSVAPYWWAIDRAVTLKGEAFFEVEKGKKFTVESEMGSTEVLGTSFNIFARADIYEVFCKTGKVKVDMAHVKEVVVLKPNEMVMLRGEGYKKVVGVTANDIVGWRENKFNFTSIPLSEVLEELERQYDVSIEVEADNPAELAYTGYFEKTATIDSTLDLVCLSFDFTFEDIGNKKYKIYRSN